MRKLENNIITKNKDIFKIWRLIGIGGVQGYSFKIFNPYVIGAKRNSQHLKKFIDFGFLNHVHNLSISLILTIGRNVTYAVI